MSGRVTVANQILKPVILLIAAAVCALSACASMSSTPAGEAPTGPIPTKLSGYFGANPLDGRTILGPPPAPDSPHGKADRALYAAKREGRDRVVAGSKV